MSKNITIQEGDVARTLTGVEKIVTNVVGGGTQNWVPEDEASQYVDTGELTVNENGTYVASDSGYIGYSRVDVQTSSRLTTKSVTENGSYDASDDGYDGYSSIDVNVEGGSTPATLITKEITENGTYDARDDEADGYSSVTVNVQYPHGKVVVPGMNHVPVRQRISTRDFIEDFNEAFFTAVESSLTNQEFKLRMEQYIRYGAWITERGLQSIYNYNNLILFAYGGFRADQTTPTTLAWGLYVAGVMDETANITVTDIGIDKATCYLYNANCFTLSLGRYCEYQSRSSSSTPGEEGIADVLSNIDNNRRGNGQLMRTWEMIPRLTTEYGINPDLPHVALVTNLMTGT